MAALSDKALAGRSIVVTGAARGIGAGIVEAVLDAGGAVALLDLDPDLAEKRRAASIHQARALSSRSPTWLTRTSLAKAAEMAAARLGNLSGWVNNAGIVQMIPAKDVSPDAWRREFDINVGGVMNGAQAAPRLRRQGRRNRQYRLQRRQGRFSQYGRL